MSAGASRAMVVACCAAVLLHAGLWWLGRGGWQTGWSGRVPSPAGAHAVHGAAMQVRFMVPAATGEATLSTLPDAVLQALPPPAAGGLPASAGGQPGVAVNYLPADDLTDRPRPEVAWQLDEDALASVRQARLTLRLWVSAEGRIDRVALLSAQPAGDWAERAVLHLSDTRMRPGAKEGRAVPSTLVVEIASEIERFR